MTTVLLVDDDADVRNVAERFLRARGYAVIVATSAEEALELAAGQPGSIDVLATDIVLPGMGGPALVRRLRSRERGVAALFLSGYAEQSGGSLDRSDLGIEDDAVFVAKPFTGDSLVSAVEAALKVRRGPGPRAGPG